MSNAQGLEPNASGECTSVEVPLDWDEPDGRTLAIDVRRLPSPEPHTVDLFLLNGGPGGSAASYERTALSLSAFWRDVRITLIDARGAGRSARLSCSAEDASSPGGAAIQTDEWDECVADLEATWGEDLAHFDSTSAARDLLHVTARFREDGVRQIVHGTSYGTFWVHRALQIEPNAWDGVVLDSVVAADMPDLSRIDAWHDEVIRDYLRVCEADAFCGARLGPDAVAYAEDVLARVSAGHCPGLVDDPGTPEDANLLLRVAFGALISNSRARAAIPAALHRVDRCTPEDLEAVRHLLVLVFGDASLPDPTEPGLFSMVLAHHVTLSELWADPPPPLDDLEAIADAAIGLKNIGVSFGSRRATWPVYAPDPAYHLQWAQTDVPMLMVNGDLDPQTPIVLARRAADVFDGPHQTFVEMPDVSHGVLTGSWISSNETCGIELLTQFMRNPEAELDLACVDAIAVRDFELNAGFANGLFGANSLWD